jgi:hypothetical protein
MYTNIRSVRDSCKLEELKVVMKMNGVDIVGLTETWLTSDIDDAEVGIEGYEVFRKDRVVGDKLRGGGVMLYVREGLVAVKDELKVSEGTESLWVRIRVHKCKELAVGICYRRPDGSREEVERIIECHEFYAELGTVIMGDYNFPDIDWEVMSSGGKGARFLEAVTEAFLTQHVRDATRGENRLDLVFTSEPDMVEYVEVGAPVGRSDHNVLIWSVMCSVEAVERKGLGRNFFKGNYEEINRELLEVKWVDEFDSCGVNEMWNKLVEKVDGLIGKYVPMRGINRKREGDKVWMNKGVIKAIEVRQRAWKRLQSKRTFENESRYKKARNEVVRKVRLAKRF